MYVQLPWVKAPQIELGCPKARNATAERNIAITIINLGHVSTIHQGLHRYSKSQGQKLDEFGRIDGHLINLGAVELFYIA